ncbi:MAG TPA: peptidylprolyl isomerase [Anaerolineales bacterium]|nr:peptidylprolyl isomerase [Anaerolineales bacterium]
MTETDKVTDGQVISMDYTLKVDGETVDSSEGQEPIEFIQGTGNIIPGLERELYGMAVGDSKDVVVSAEDGYGKVDDEAYMDVPRNQFPADIPMEVGTQLELHDREGHPMHARIEQVGEESVRLDFNHPLAGKELHFAVKIAGLRAATAEELDHGHVHSADHQHG